MKGSVALSDGRRRELLSWLLVTGAAYIDDIRTAFYEGRLDRCRYDINVLQRARFVRKVDRKTAGGRSAVVLTKHGAGALGLASCKPPDRRDLAATLWKATVYFRLRLGGIPSEAILPKKDACGRCGFNFKRAKALAWYVTAREATTAFYAGSTRHLSASIAAVVATRFHVAVVREPKKTALSFLKPGARMLPATRVFFIQPEAVQRFVRFLQNPLGWVERAKAALEHCLGRHVNVSLVEKHSDLCSIEGTGYTLVHGNFFDVGPAAHALRTSKRVLVYLDSFSDASVWLKRVPGILCLVGDAPAILAKGSKKPVTVNSSSFLGGGSL